MNDLIKYTSYANGTIRNAAGKLVAYFDAANETLDVDGWAHTIYGVDSLEFAMDIVDARLSSLAKGA